MTDPGSFRHDPPGPEAPRAAAPGPGAPAPAAGEPDRRPRPLLERIGLAAVALVLAGMFALVAAASFVGGEPFLGVIGILGCLMVLWVGGLSLVRG